MEKLYKPIIIKKEVDNEHFYYVNDKFVAGVTTILSETLPTPYALRKWIGDIGTEKAEERLEKAGDRGSRIHDACERLLRGEQVKLAEEFLDINDKKCIASFIAWANEYKPVVKDEGIEFTVASQLGYAGTLDIFCEIKGEPYIIDIKTSASIYDSHKLQITAYQNAFYEMTGIMAKRAILHLNFRTIKGFSFEEKIEIGKKDVEISDFVKVLEVYKMLNGGIIPEPKLKNVYPGVVSLYENNK